MNIYKLSPVNKISENIIDTTLSEDKIDAIINLCRTSEFKPIETIDDYKFYHTLKCILQIKKYKKKIYTETLIASEYINDMFILESYERNKSIDTDFEMSHIEYTSSKFEYLKFKFICSDGKYFKVIIIDNSTYMIIYNNILVSDTYEFNFIIDKIKSIMNIECGHFDPSSLSS